MNLQNNACFGILIKHVGSWLLDTTSSCPPQNCPPEGISDKVYLTLKV